MATTDAAGAVWLAWQSWHGHNFDIVLASLADGGEPRVISQSKANDWSPAIAADKRGNVYVAYDTYDKGNYDVLLYVAGKEPRTVPVATSAKLEARPHLAVDAQDRVWIAYEEGDEQWGKDHAHAGSIKNVGLDKNLGFALYVHRTVRVKCLAGGQLMEPTAHLERAFKKRHSYAATDNILVDVRSGDHLMGDAFETDKRPRLTIHIVGTGPVAKVHVLRDNKYVYSNEPKGQEVSLRCSHADAPAGKTCFYYVRVEQADGNLAWSSPLWKEHS